MSWGLISEMGHVAIQTTRLEDSVFDATQVLGLRETGRDEHTVFLAAADVHHELMYQASEHDGIDHIGLVAADRGALAEVRRRIDAGGWEVVSESPLEEGIEEGFAFEGPEGFIYEVYVGMARQDAPQLGFGPDRFGHINIHPQDVEAYKTFLTDVLDFRISDVIGDDFAYFLRCNADHHGIALIAGRGTMHHHAWQAQSIVDLGKLGDRLDRLRRQMIWGPVRHGAGHNIAAYFVEPSGGVIELYADLEQIYDDNRPPVVWNGDDNRWFSRWGVYRGQDFRTHGLFPAPRNR
ncbi:Catechol-2,3-dioxygenase [Microbacterium saccharophilum]|uniref:Catechol-2,3-dioxygenase n=1 Tax=Microbacterium saccharophilum TaxID=1213358 RepID=A0A7Z7GDK4_9MICO|nr:Catechol-2,3-dioxygenase [Microbacterium saccharophilum]